MRVVEDDPLVVVSALPLTSIVGGLCRKGPQDAAGSAGRCSSPPSPDRFDLGLAVIRKSSGKTFGHVVEASPPLLVVPLSGFGVLEELDRAPLPNMSPDV